MTKSIEMDIISHQLLDGCVCGAATWMARVLKAEESQIILGIDARHMHARATETQRLSFAQWQDNLHTQIDWLCKSVARFLGDDWNDEISDNHISIAEIDQNDSNDVFEDSYHTSNSNAMLLPLPSFLGLQ